MKATAICLGFLFYSSLCLCQGAQTTIPTAPDTKVFGLQLGSQLTLPECKKMKISKNGYVYSGSDTAWCYQRLDKSVQGPVVNETVEIKFPYGDRPEIATGLSLVGGIINGKLEGIGFNTLGAGNDQQVMEKLTAKYGKPTASEPYEVQNRMGAKFKSIRANWQFSNLVIEFQGIASSIDSGLVTIDTPVSKAAREQALKKLSAGRSL